MAGGPGECVVCWQHFDEYTLVGIVGLLSFSVIDPFESVVLGVIKEARRPLVIDLSGTEGMDSSGLGTLVKLSDQGSRRVLLVRPNSCVKRHLAITRLDTFFEVYDSLDEAKVRVHKQEEAYAVPASA